MSTHVVKGGDLEEALQVARKQAEQAAVDDAAARVRAWQIYARSLVHAPLTKAESLDLPNCLQMLGIDEATAQADLHRVERARTLSALIAEVPSQTMAELRRERDACEAALVAARRAVSRASSLDGQRRERTLDLGRLKADRRELFDALAQIEA